MAAEPKQTDLRETAAKEYKDGNYLDAYHKYQQLIRMDGNNGETLKSDIAMGANCLQSLRKLDELDEFLEDVVEVKGDDWRALWQIAEEKINRNHQGFIIAGEFKRAHRRGGGRYVSAWDRDRVQAIRWMLEARKQIPDEASRPLVAKFYNQFGYIVQYGRAGNAAWKLQDLTETDELPDYAEGHYYGGGRNQGAPVDADGNPVFHAVPESYETAQSDGERWRWCQEQIKKYDPSRTNEVDSAFASFLHQQFGVQTLAQWNIRLPGVDENDGDDEGEKDTGVWSLPTLDENETIVRLATGVKRIELPDEFNYIRIYQRIAKGEGSISESALTTLSRIFTDRQQYPKAAELWRENIRRFRTQRYKRDSLDQIVKNWGQIEGTSVFAAGEGAQIDYRFRNGDKVQFEAQSIDVSLLINDIKDYLKSSPKQVDWQKLQIDHIGYQLVNGNQQKYLGEKMAEWSLDVKPRENHFDRRVTVTTPLQKAGAYLVTSKMEDGNTSRVIVWIDDTAITSKRLNNKNLYYIADAKTGQPIEKAKVEFFGWKNERVPNTKRDYRVLTQNFAEFSGDDGVIVTDNTLMSNGYNWLTIARTDDGRFAHLGFSGVWYGQYHHTDFGGYKAYAVTDRPVYRPEQKVQFKFWMRETRYDKKPASRFANKNYTIKINDPQGKEIYSEKLKTDEFAGLVGEFQLDEEPKLGQYYLYVHHGQEVGGGIHFRVEEYKKPEFEVTIEAPDKPVQLGEKITAKINAKYFYGAPVTKATVKFKVERSSHDTRWFPYTKWDWLYGGGYWWFTPEYDWYPGFARWGCMGPIRPWWNWNPDPPELVLDREVEIGVDGTVEFEIDTELAKVLHGDQDHEYKVTAEVTDASRRTIVGQGNVLVAREPFRVFSWTHRGHYKSGDTIEAHFQARTLDGNGVSGSGKLQLLKINYKDGEPVETVAGEWDLDPNEDGSAIHKLTAAAPGQYRLSYKVTAEIGANDADGEPQSRTIEGGNVFIVRGDQFDGSDYNFNDLELVIDQQTYQPGETVELMINTKRLNSTVLLFLRPVNGICLSRPQVIRMEGKSKTVSIKVTKKDMPNFFVEAITVSSGKVHSAVQQIVVPPEERVLDVEIVTSSDRYQPGEKANVEIKLTGPDGEPIEGSVAMTVYDRAVEYISGGSNVGDIKEFFWNWKRNHNPSTQHNLNRRFGQLLKSGEIGMGDLGAFGRLVADMDEADGFEDDKMKRKSRSLSSRSRSGGMGGLPEPMSAAPAAEMSLMADSMEMAENEASAPGGGAAAGVEPTVRTKFADTAFWVGAVTTDRSGIAKVSFDMPENLSGWKLRAWGMGHGTNVGEGTAEVVTAKNIVVRLQAPRFFTETDEVVLSAVVHNYLKTDKDVLVQLNLGESGTLEPIEANGDQTVHIAAGGEARVDWRVRAVNPGTASITMSARTDEESDAMQMEFPVYIHGFLKTESFSGVVRANEKSGVIDFTVPEERQPEQTRLEVRYSPTLAGAMVDALPYLVEYPYGCTEQTLNRFVPTVVTQNILRGMDVDLAAIQKKRTNLNAQEIGEDVERAKQWKHWKRNPVFDETEVQRMIKKGVKDLTEMQNSDGGWGWFSGFGERSYPHTTAVVVHGLQLAQKNDIAIVDGVVAKGVAWLKQYQDRQVALLLEGERREKFPDEYKNPAKKYKPYKTSCSNIDAMLFTTLIDAKIHDDQMHRFLYRDRLKVSPYSQALIGVAFHDLESFEQRDMIVKNLDQFLKVDNENQTAYLDLPNGGYWWYWYGNTIEANAQYLRLLTRVNVDDPKASGLVKYILNNRKHGTYWNSTRDTAYCIEALAEYLTASGEGEPNMVVDVVLDGEVKQTVEITKENLFTFDNSFVIEGDALSSGKHKLELRKRAAKDGANAGPLYHNAYLANFTLEEFITKAGLEIKVEREYYKLVQDKEATKAVAGSRGQVVDQSVIKYNRERLENLAEVNSGDLIEIELKIESKNDYEYVMFEDNKAAGCEPVTVRSGYTRDGLGAYVEFRDEKVTFFMRRLARGTHSVSYRVRAEVPGKFSALPVHAEAMYAPELKANSDEMKLRIGERLEAKND